MKQLNPKAVWLFFVSQLFGVLFLVLWLGIFLLPIIFEGKEVPDLMSSILWAILILVVAILINYIIAKLSYRFYRYELRDDCFRKESGIIWKKYVSIPYERVQNVDLYRGLIARILGLSDLHIQTAGSSAMYVKGFGSQGLSAEGRLPGLSFTEAEQIRDELIKRAKGAKGQGL